MDENSNNSKVYGQIQVLFKELKIIQDFQEGSHFSWIFQGGYKPCEQVPNNLFRFLFNIGKMFGCQLEIFRIHKPL